MGTMLEAVNKKRKYIQKGAEIGDNLGWVGAVLPLPLFIILSIMLALIGGGVGFIIYLTNKLIKRRTE